MARIARVVVPEIPHHVTQRGVRRMNTFFKPEDYVEYLSLMRTWCLSSGVEIWAYCLMPNHVHLIAVPKSSESLARTIAVAVPGFHARLSYLDIFHFLKINGIT
jgi:putative transposase